MDKPMIPSKKSFFSSIKDTLLSSSNKTEPIIINEVSIPSKKFTNNSTKEPPFNGDIIISVSNSQRWTNIQGPIGYLVFFNNKIYFINTNTFAGVKSYTIDLTNHITDFMSELQKNMDHIKYGKIYGDVSKFEWTLIDKIITYGELNSKLRTATQNPELVKLKNFIYNNFEESSKPTEHMWNSTGGKKSRKSKRRIRKTRRLNKKRINK